MCFTVLAAALQHLAMQGDQEWLTVSQRGDSLSTSACYKVWHTCGLRPLPGTSFPVGGFHKGGHWCGPLGACSTLCIHAVSNLMTLHNGVARLAEGCGLSVDDSDEVLLLTPPLLPALARPPAATPLLLLHLEQPYPASDSIISRECSIQLPNAPVAAEVRERLGKSLALPSLPFPSWKLRRAGQHLGCCCCIRMCCSPARHIRSLNISKHNVSRGTTAASGTTRVSASPLSLLWAFLGSRIQAC